MKPEQLEKFVTALYKKQGFCDKHAKICAWHTTLAEKWGVKTHGINLLEWYIHFIRQGSIRTDPQIQSFKKNEVFRVLDAGRAHGQVATYIGAEIAIDGAKDNQMLCVTGIVNSNHIGTAGAPAYQIAKQGCIGIVLSSTPPIMAPPGSVEKALGSNPLSIAFPRLKGEPFVLDMSTTVSALNKIIVAKRENKPVPTYSYLNSKGKFTTDIKEIEAHKLAAPLGKYSLTSGYKGYGLAFMSELLAACMLGGMTSDKLFNWNRNEKGLSPESHVIISVKADVFRNIEQIEKDAVDLVRFIKARKKADRVSEIFIPGEDRYKSKLRAEEHELSLSDWQIDLLDKLSEKYQISLNL